MIWLLINLCWSKEAVARPSIIAAMIRLMTIHEVTTVKLKKNGIERFVPHLKLPLACPSVLPPLAMYAA